MKEELFKKHYEYILWKEDSEVFLSVLCGTSAMYCVDVKLMGDALQAALDQHYDYFDEMSKRVRSEPERWRSLAC